MPLAVITTGGNVNDVTQAVALLNAVPPIAGRPGRPRRRFDAVLADKGYDSDPLRRDCKARRIVAVIPRRGTAGISGLGKFRYVVEQTFALLHQFRRLAIRWERRADIHHGLVTLACTLICWRRLKQPQPRSC